MANRRISHQDVDLFPPEIQDQIKEKMGEPPARKSIRRLEQELQIECISWADSAEFPDELSRLHRWLMPPVKIGDYLHHTPNGGGRSRAEGGIFKAMGVRAGYPDLSLDICMVDNDDIYAGWRCELKIGDAIMRPNQILRAESLWRAGYYFCEARCLSEFQSQLGRYLELGRPLHRTTWP